VNNQPEPGTTTAAPSALAATGGAGPRGVLRRVDWQFFKGSAMTTLGIVAARVLGFVYSFLLARSFSTEDFGSVQYTLTLATLAALATVPFAEQVLPWFISRFRDDAARLDETVRHGWLVLLALYGGTLVVAAPLLAASGRPWLVVLVIFSGVTLFNVYLGLARGFMAPGRLLLAYLGSNLLQLVAVLAALRVLGTASTTPVLLIYGLSYLLPVVLLQAARPFPVAFRLPVARRAVLAGMLRFAAPVWGSHALYTLSFALDVLLLERFWDEATVGVYALTKTIVMGFSFVPQGITVMLMPRVARGGGQRRLLAAALVATVAASAVALVVYVAVYEWFVVAMVGGAYFVGMPFALLMALSAIVYGVHAILTSYLIGSGRPGLETASRGVMAVTLLGAGVLLVPPGGVLGAAWANVLCAAAGVLAYLVILGLERARAARS
jgi:O-antigen/teichoic acid export membrane protein